MSLAALTGGSSLNSRTAWQMDQAAPRGIEMRRDRLMFTPDAELAINGNH
jgi:hypothetical protein